MFTLSMGVLGELVATPPVPTDFTAAPGGQHWPDSLVNDDVYGQTVV